MKKRTFLHKGKEYKYSISLGYVEYPTYAHKGSELLRYADIALYEVKLRGKHGCLPYRASYRVSDSKRSQLGFKLNDISNNLPGAFFIYKADKSDEQILYANNEMLRLVEKRIWEQISINDNKVNDYVRYRMATKSGEYKNVLDYGRLVHSENYGLVFYVLIVDFDFINTSADFEA